MANHHYFYQPQLGLVIDGTFSLRFNVHENEQDHLNLFYYNMDVVKYNLFQIQRNL